MTDEPLINPEGLNVSLKNCLPVRSRAQTGEKGNRKTFFRRKEAEFLNALTSVKNLSRVDG